MKPLTVPHQTLQSSNLASAAYDAESKTLEVVFNNGSRFHYENVAPHHFTNLTTHKSPGSYFHTAIRAAHKASKVEE